MTETRVPALSVVGKSNVGKTTMLEKLIAELKRRGYRVAVVKHDAHSFDIDIPGKDTWRLAQAGADQVVIASPQKVALIRRLESEWPLERILQEIRDVDLVLTEGYKRGPLPKIEVSRRERSESLICTAEELVAIASDQPFELAVPQFSLDDTVGLTDFLEDRYLRPRDT
ncbi:MAG: molybdopterin-guanine dinucleotide biosynthesis protein B [Chloroflexi bacterium]|nr:molybdopterin-guanine dinucleotide biosynthesis protein B [Chloroflexota bacterium]